MSERIVRVAIKHNGALHIGGKGERHHHVINRVGKPGDPVDMDGQGFMTDQGRWVDRKEACRIATAAGQIIKKHDPQGLLFSEDVW